MLTLRDYGARFFGEKTESEHNYDNTTIENDAGSVANCSEM